MLIQETHLANQHVEVVKLLLDSEFILTELEVLALMKNVWVKQEMISKMAREVVKETSSKSYGRSQREKNFIICNMKESNKKEI